MSIAITTKDINELLGLFQQLEPLLRPELPAKSNELWEKSLDQAKQELGQQLKQRQSGLTLSPTSNNAPRRTTITEEQEIQQQFKERILQIAEKKYCEKDPTYAKAVEQAKSKTADVLKSIDHLLLAIRQPLLQFPRVQNTLLTVDWKEDIRDYYPFLDKDNLSYQIREAIDVLEAFKLQLERQQTKEVESQQLPLEKPAETEQKTTPSSMTIQNSNVILGHVQQSGNLQVGDRTQIQEVTGTEGKKKGILKRLSKIVGTIIVGIIVAVITDILGDFGLIEGIRAFIYRIIGK